jgi:acetyl-CoA synthetase (ADP-forming)
MPSIRESLDAAFKPEAIAIIGASNNMSKLGASDLRRLIEFGYKGRIYPVNPKEDIVQGYKAFKSVLDIPEPVDRAVIILPTKYVPDAVKECAEKGIKVVQIYSAGFGEFGDEGKALEREMLATAQRYEMRIIGPNCIGTYCPAGGLSFTKSKQPVHGSIAFISQSGGIAHDIVSHGSIQGIYYSKVISVGNCIDLDHSDFVEYLAQDPETKAIGMYVESIKDGKRFMDVLKRTTLHKPVVILKGGRTESGIQSVASHTGNLAGNYNIWEALFEQTGAIAVKSLEEMITALNCIQNLRNNPNGNIALVGNGGGATVLATDVCEEVGLGFAQLSDRSVEKLHEMQVAESGRNVNPVDLPARELTAEEGKRFINILETFVKDGNVPYLVFHINLIPLSNNMNLQEILRKMFEPLDFINQTNTNVIGVLRTDGDSELIKTKLEASRFFLQPKGIPVFSTIEQALFGISLMVEQGKRAVEGGFYEHSGESKTVVE